jgi:AcrR family transcriptional regulator
MASTMATSAESTLRGQQKDLARRLIVDATARVILRTGIHQFSMQEVADEAGIALRTLYRYFASREELVDGVGREIDQIVGEVGIDAALAERPTSASSIAAHATAALAAGEARSQDLARAWVVITTATGARSASSRRRDLLVRDAVADLAPQLAPRDADCVAAMVRVVATSRTWRVLRDDLGLPADEAARAVEWALRTLLEAAQAGRGPAERS